MNIQNKSQVPSNLIRLAKYALLFSFAQSAVIAGVALLWGSGQLFQPAALQGRLSENMTIGQVEASLALPPGSLAKRMERIRPNNSSVSLAKPGLGSWFVPQYAVVLVFDSEKKLQRCVVEIHWQVDEMNIPFSI